MDEAGQGSKSCLKVFPRVDSIRCEICLFCNRVSEERVLEAIRDGKAKNLSEIFDQTGAGTGPCGGSCRPKLTRMLSEFSNENKTETLTLNQQETPSDVLLEAMSFFNRRFYWEAHEVLEKEWKLAQGTEKTFYQGLIQGAAAYYHVLGGNAQAALKLAREAISRLEGLPKSFQGFESENFLLALKVLVNEAKEVLGSIRPSFSYENLPKWTLKKGID